MKLIALGEVAIIDRTNVNPLNIADGTLYVGLENITENGDFVGVRPIYSGDVQSSKFIFTEEHILYGKLRPYLKKISIPTFSGVCSTDILPIKPQKFIDKRYLFYALRQPSLIDLASSLSSGANLPRLNPERLKEFLIPVPPLAEQKRIAYILDLAAGLQAKRRQTITRLDALLQSTFLEMFGDPVTNPKGWEVKSLAEICDSKGQYGSGASAIPYEKVKPRYIRITDINENGELNQEKVSPNTESTDWEKYLLKKGDIIFARSGATVGKTYLYQESDGYCIYAGYLIKFHPIPTIATPEFVFNFTHTRSYKTWVESKQKVVAQPNINAQQYGDELFLPIPSLVLQNRFVEICHKINKQKEFNLKSLTTLDTLFASLQQRAFSGRL